MELKEGVFSHAAAAPQSPDTMKCGAVAVQ